MALPKAVLAAEKEADRLHREAYPEQYEGKPKKEALKAVKEEPKPVEEKTDPALPQSGDKPVNQPTEGAIQIPATEQAVGPSSDLASQLAAERHKNSVLQGKYNAEIPVLHTEVRELKSEVESLKAGAATKAAENNTGEFASKLKEDLEGSETAENIIGTVDERVSASEERMLKKLEESIGPIKKKTALTDEQKFYTGLSQVENWQDINKNAEFSKWLDTENPVTGYTYRAWLNDAWHKKNATRAVEIFKAWPGYKQKAKAQTTVEEMVSPGQKMSQTETEKGPETERISQEQIRSFYKDVQKGKYTDKEVKQHERTLEKAIREHRVD
ncbi:MAG: hypothetical protein ABGX83_05550 [Nitrospira sp.]